MASSVGKKTTRFCFFLRYNKTRGLAAANHPNMNSSSQVLFPPQENTVLVQSAVDTVVGGLLGKVVVVQQWGIEGREGAVDP